MLTPKLFSTLLKNHGLSVYDLSVDLDIPVPTLKRYLNGKESPSKPIVNLMSDYFQEPLDDS